MRKLLFGLVLVLVLSAAVSGVALAFFSDLTGHWAASIISALEAKGIVGGDERGRFTPDAPLTRAQMAKLFSIGLGYDSQAQALSKYPSRYVDVSVWHWGRGYIESVTELGIVEGYPGERFGPDDLVTRAQLAVLAVRAAELSEQARLARFERTPYSDDVDIPSWARGAVFVAQREGLIAGTSDGHFLPGRAVTRAEASALVFRLMERKGVLFHLAGTLVRYDPERLTGTVRDSLGQERSFAMEADATYVRQGAPALPDQVRLLDQVFVILDETGVGKFMEARYQDLLVDSAVVRDGGLEVTYRTGEQGFQPVQPGALVFVNGRPARLEDVSGTGPVYLLFDQTTGDVRLIDAVRTPIQGVFAGLTETGEAVRILVDQQAQAYTLAPTLVVIVDGEKTGLSSLAPGDEVRCAVDAEGRLTYVEVTR